MRTDLTDLSLLQEARVLPHSPIVMMSWGARVLYLGPSFSLSPHRNAVGVLCICLDGDMDVVVGDGVTEQHVLVCRTVYVPPGTRHLIRFRSAGIACLYVDRESDDPSRIQAAMKPGVQGLWVDYRRHDTVVQVLKALAERRLPRDRRKALVAEAFGLTHAGEVHGDERIALAIRTIHDDPAKPHRVTTLARHVGLSASRFRHAFRQATGVSLKRYRVWIRIGAAMGAVHDGANLTKAAHGAGFSSSAHFSTAYRAMFGMAPSAFIAIAQSFKPIEPNAPGGSGSDNGRTARATGSEPETKVRADPPSEPVRLTTAAGRR